MKKTISVLASLLLASSLFAEMTGYEIMKKADEVPEPKTSSAKATLTIHSKKGNDRIREIIIKSKEYGDVTKEVIVFTTPKDVDGVGYLMFDYPEDDNGNKKDSDNWLYMPAMKKTRRIAASGSDGDSYFMGTDFTYEDIGERGLNKDNYVLLGEENVNGTDCYKIEAVSKTRKEKDPRRILYIGKEDFLLYKAEFFDRQDVLHRVIVCSNFSFIGGYKSAKTMKMENVQTGTWSMFETRDHVYDSVDIDDSLFTVAALEKQRIK